MIGKKSRRPVLCFSFW